MKQVNLENLTTQKIKENNGQPLKNTLKEYNMENSKDKSIIPSTSAKNDSNYPKKAFFKNISEYNLKEELDEFKDDYEKAIEEKKEDPKTSEKTEIKEFIKTESMINYSQHNIQTIITQKIQNKIIYLEKQEKKRNRKNNSHKSCPYLEKKLLEKITHKNMNILCKKNYYKKDKLFKIIEINGLGSKINEIDNLLEQQKCKYKKDDKNIISNINIINKKSNNSSNINLELNLTDVSIPSFNEVLGKTDINHIVNIVSNQESNLLSFVLIHGMSINSLSSTNSKTI